MRIIRVDAVQAHAVPKSAHAPRGPFPPEMQGYNPGYVERDDETGAFDLRDTERYDEDSHPAAQPEIVYDYAPEQNEDGTGFAPGSTAQNGFKPEKKFRCRLCLEVLFEHELDEHDCEE